MKTAKDWKWNTRHISPMSVGTDAAFIIAGLIDDIEESQNETAALRDALSELKRFVDVERHDSENIAAIINGALRLPGDVAAQPNEKGQAPRTCDTNQSTISRAKLRRS